MTTNHADPTVEALAIQLHDADCRPLFTREPRWADDHHVRDRTKARRILIGLADEGYQLLGPGERPDCQLCARDVFHQHHTPVVARDPGEVA